MLKNNKGISLIVLVLIIIAVLVISAVSVFLIRNKDNNVNISNSNKNNSNIVKENEQVNESDDTKSEYNKNETKEEKISLTDDLTAFGYLYKDLFVLSSDVSTHKTVDEVAEYITQKGLNVYPYLDSDLTKTKTIEEIYNKNEWILKPDDFINSIHDKYNGKYSNVIIDFKNDENNIRRVSCIQYAANSLYDSSVPNDFRNFMNKQLEKFESTKIVGDYNNWNCAYIYLGRKLDKDGEIIQNEIAKITAMIGETSCSLTIEYM